MSEEIGLNTPNEDEKYEKGLDERDVVCDSILVMGGNQLITELQAKVAYHERELAVWRAALESALRSEGKPKSQKGEDGKWRSLKAESVAIPEVTPSPYIMGLVVASGHAGITSNEIKSKGNAAKLGFADDKGFPYKQLNRLKRIGKVKNENGKYFLAR